MVETSDTGYKKGTYAINSVVGDKEVVLPLLPSFLGGIKFLLD